ncbi:hypothetical protein [Dickeya poaceiphila]|uniref:Uncharacterized protein n=1 Tax=Dickeya poaceiphila TaxID=568768 RepID=A0A5B8HHL4_9GAMM|nr:hypothetical protein [Dickeya poaceiphila]QDX29066.1 hypothetical protein Dpoa569_0000773 [Dickeya poaceiphila]
MYQSMIFQLVSLGIAMSAEPSVDLRGVWKKMTLLDDIEKTLSFEQRAIVTRGRILMFEGQTRFFAFLQSVCHELPDTPWKSEMSELLAQVGLPAFIEDREFISHYIKDKAKS